MAGSSRDPDLIGNVKDPDPRQKGKEPLVSLESGQDTENNAGVTLFGTVPERMLAISNTLRANLVGLEKGEYLVLPDDTYPTGRSCHPWQDHADDLYPANAIYVRSCYVEIARLLLERAEASVRADTVRTRMTLWGTSGTGKSFFMKYFVWRLLHPPPGTPIPDVIIWKHTQGGRNGSLYAMGKPYFLDDVYSFVGSIACKNLVYGRDAWVIFDGEPPKDPPNCNYLVAASPGNINFDMPHVKRYHRGSTFNAYLPTWSINELVEVATTVHRIPSSDLATLVTRYAQFGGIARYVLGATCSANDEEKASQNPIQDSLTMNTVVKALIDVGSKHIHHRSTSESLVHMIPDSTYRKYTYQWGSKYIMMEAFKTLFKLKRKEIECLIIMDEGLPLGTFYGLLFEPLFHARVTEVGYRGRIRKLKSGREMQRITKRKRWNLGIRVDPLGSQTYAIPRLTENKFLNRKQIKAECYNIPNERNYESLDSLCPARGEIFKVTSSDAHPIKTKNLTLLRPLFEDYLTLNPNQKVKFIFVVPPERFESFIIQPYISRQTISQGKEESETDLTSKGTKDSKAPLTKAEKADATAKMKQERKLQQQRRKELQKKKDEIKKAERTKKTGMKKGKQKDDDVENGSEPVTWEVESEEIDDDDFDDCWLEQFVLEMDVDVLTDAVAARNMGEKRPKTWLERVSAARAAMRVCSHNS